MQLLVVTRNTIDETAIVIRYFAIISRVAKWHAVLFEGALLIKITTILMLLAPYWDNNRGCGINQGNTVCNYHDLYNYCHIIPHTRAAVYTLGVILVAYEIFTQANETKRHSTGYYQSVSCEYSLIS